MENSYINWRLKIENNLARLCFDRADSSTNTINFAVLDELEDILNKLFQSSATVQGLIISSAKDNGFIAGADINAMRACKTREEIERFVSKGQAVFAQLARAPMPTLAVIQGFCLGGGLELALACRYRIVIRDPKTRLGLPEILLGLHPGWGGTVRLPHLIGAFPAMRLILTGQTVDAETAVKIGLADAVVPKHHLERAEAFYMKTLPHPHQANWLQRLTNSTLIRPTVAKILRRKLAEKTSPEHYPAPFAVINHWEHEGVNTPHAYEREAASTVEMALTKTARHLTRVFFLRERLKKLAQPLPSFSHLHVVGAGTMGGDIAAWCALQGLTVTLQDINPASIASTMKRAYNLYQKKLKTPSAIQSAMDRLIPDDQGHGIAQADIIIEAVLEDVTLKQDTFKKIEPLCKPNAILASNTSSISLDDIACVLKNPERLVGIHFFNPVAHMQLIEVISADKTSGAVIDQALAFVRQIDRLPLPVKNSPGFLVNRLLMLYLTQAFLLLEQGVSPSLIDKAAIDFGMPMGPIELADAIGLDVCLAVAKILAEKLNRTVPACLEKAVAKNQWGRKTSQGFYKYKHGKPIPDKNMPDKKLPSDFMDDTIALMYAEAQNMLKENVVADADLVDAGIIFAAGFAPFTGGLVNYYKESKSEHTT